MPHYCSLLDHGAIPIASDINIGDGINGKYSMQLLIALQLKLKVSLVYHISHLLEIEFVDAC